jgi:glycine cleavage system H protein
MGSESSSYLLYKRARFATQLPLECRYSPSHYWMAPQGGRGRLWRIGLTKFGTRMLGEMVEYTFDVKPKDRVGVGQILGWIEGFKAISDIFCIAEGTFAEANPALSEQITLVNQDPYGAGWLYSIRGVPDASCMDVHAYKVVLDKSIDKLLKKRKQRKPSSSH